MEVFTEMSWILYGFILAVIGALVFAVWYGLYMRRWLADKEWMKDDDEG